MLHRLHIVYAFIHEARQFLQARKAVEFQRIELLVTLVSQRNTRLYLALGLNFHLAQLLAQARHAARQLHQTFLEGTHLGFHTRPCHANLACLINQTINYLRTYPQHAAQQRAFRPDMQHTRRGSSIRRHRGKLDIVLRLCGRFHLNDTRTQFVQQHVNAVKINFQRIPNCHLSCLHARQQAAFHTVCNITDTHRACHPRTPLEGMQQSFQ